MTRSRTVSLLVLSVIIAACAADVALAQGSPFGQLHAPVASSGSSLIAWIFAKQAEFYRSLSTAIRASGQDSSANWGLFATSFLYGVFHAVGPGHGKAVISSYLVANQETWRRGVVLSFASAGIQSVVAIIVVAVAAILLGTTAKIIGLTTHVIEIVSYGLVILIGLRLLFVKSRALLIAFRELTWREVPILAVPSGISAKTLLLPGRPTSMMALSASRCQVADCGHINGFHCEHDHDHHESAWGHSHGPTPADLAGAGGWRRGFAAVVAVGLRPCSGAIIVLIFALAQDLFWTGVVATLLMGLGTAVMVAAIATVAVSARRAASRIAEARPGIGMLAMRTIEVCASATIVVFGTLLLAGYAATEQVWMFAR
jgi:nickel/cobalt exporter